ncbi:MAG: low temperature requirement protein A, partial [Thermocrispum sp.]
MRSRDPRENHRVATPLELLFDLCFVVAIALAAAELHHALIENHVLDGLQSFGMAFFAIWWAWMNFTWFASAYDTDDALYRLTTFVQMAGVLVLAAGVPSGARNEFTLVVVGYVLMRIAMVTQWLRVAASDPARRRCALRYAGGIFACQVFWTLLVLAPGYTLLVFAVGVVAELAVPVWAERVEPTTWHPHHIAERYGLFTIIVLGESILAATTAIQEAISAGRASAALATLAVAGLVIVFSMWWLYFSVPAHDLLS